MYQRFSFDNLSPERQMELVEKRRKQQQQREILLQQIESRKKEKDNTQEKENYRDVYQEPIQIQPQPQQMQSPIISIPTYQFPQNKNQLQPTTIDFSKTSVASSNFRKQQLIFTPQNYSLLPDRQPVRSLASQNHDKQMMTMSLTPNTIHDAFASLRHQIMATAASSVIGGGTDSHAMRERKISDTF